MECDDKCAFKRYCNYHMDGRGYVPVSTKVELMYGLAVHAAIDHAATGNPKAMDEAQRHAEGLRKLTDPTPDGFTLGDELLAMLKGQTQTFKRYTLPRILEEYEWIESEVEIEIEFAPGFLYLARLDGILRRRLDDYFFVLEAKTTRYPQDLAAAAPTNFQLLLEIEALKTRFPKAKIGGAQLLTFAKGMNKKASKREQAMGMDGYRQLSPFTYWYGREEADGTQEYRLDWASKWDRVPTWTIPNWYEIAAANWPDEIRSQIQFWPGIRPDDDRVKRVLRQRLFREEQISYFKPLVPVDPETHDIRLDQIFRQNFGNCENDGGFRRPCPYKAICYSPNVAADPLASGLYEVRSINHPKENEIGD
jgi:hypothetical protein